MGFRKLGIATCVGLIDESRVLAKILRKNGFEVTAAACKIGSFRKTDVGVDLEHITKTGEFMCNPILQAEVLNREHTDLNIVMGLCVGHDSLFYKYSDALVTTLVAKDRVLAEDILRYLESTREKADEAPREETVPMNGMRKAIARNMLNSHMTSPTVTANLSVDMSAMKAYREQLKAKEIKVSYTDLLVKFIAKALTEFPLLNCSVEDNKIVYKHYVNMGVAVALDNGLVVPNVPDADKKSLTEISKEIKELAKLAREGGLPMEKLRGGTFTITNLGMYGIESFTPIINQPEVAILGVTTMEDRAVVRGGEIVIRPMMTLSLTFDHRVVDGSVAAEFLQRVKALLENPALMLA
jgi:pyruvate dehydrogenase E2 component (dihydrolipoamide acetyltransferase)